jgi:hypothetical protein
VHVHPYEVVQVSPYADSIRSVKIDSAVTDMTVRLDHIGGVSGVDELKDRAAALWKPT